MEVSDRTELLSILELVLILFLFHFCFVFTFVFVFNKNYLVKFGKLRLKLHHLLYNVSTKKTMILFFLQSFLITIKVVASSQFRLMTS